MWCILLFRRIKVFCAYAVVPKKKEQKHRKKINVCFCKEGKCSPIIIVYWLIVIFIKQQMRYSINRIDTKIKRNQYLPAISFPYQKPGPPPYLFSMYNSNVFSNIVCFLKKISNTKKGLLYEKTNYIVKCFKYNPFFKLFV